MEKEMEIIQSDEKWDNRTSKPSGISYYYYNYYYWYGLNRVPPKSIY